jgi:pilus assembly protein Flp/PilA
LSENLIQIIRKLSAINHRDASRLNLQTVHVSNGRRDGAGMRKFMTKLVHRFLRDDSGATSVEYAAIASLVSIVIVGAVAGLSSKLKASYTSVQASLQ